MGANQDLPLPFSPLLTVLCQHNNPPFWTVVTIITCRGLGKNSFLIFIAEKKQEAQSRPNRLNRGF